MAKTKQLGELIMPKRDFKVNKLSKEQIAEIYEESIKYNPELADACKEIARRKIQIESGDLDQAIKYRDFKRYGMTPERYKLHKELQKSSG